MASDTDELRNPRVRSFYIYIDKGFLQTIIFALARVLTVAVPWCHPALLHGRFRSFG